MYSQVNSDNPETPFVFDLWLELSSVHDHQGLIIYCKGAHHVSDVA